MVDLSHTLTADFPLFPVYDPVRVRERFAVERDGFFVKNCNALATSRAQDCRESRLFIADGRP